MKVECILAPQNLVKERTLKSFLTQEQIKDVQSGKLVTVTSTGQKVKLDDEVSETILMLTPLCAG
jgi:hypothetical protein